MSVAGVFEVLVPDETSVDMTGPECNGWETKVFVSMLSEIKNFWNEAKTSFNVIVNTGSTISPPVYFEGLWGDERVARAATCFLFRVGLLISGKVLSVTIFDVDTDGTISVRYE
jgi:hypothetical protein